MTASPLPRSALRRPGAILIKSAATFKWRDAASPIRRPPPTKEWSSTDDRSLQLQPLHLRPGVRLRRCPCQDLQVRSRLQVRPRLRLRGLSATRRSAPPALRRKRARTTERIETVPKALLLLLVAGVLAAGALLPRSAPNCARTASAACGGFAFSLSIGSMLRVEVGGGA